MNKIFVLALIGGIIAILLSFFFIAVGLAFSGILRSVGFYVSEGTYSSAQTHPYVDLFVATKNLIYGSIGLFAGIIGIIGGKISKVKGGILLVVASGISVLALGYLGIISFVLLLISGLLALSLRPTPQITSLPN
jgi:hypothetical protein